MSGQVTLYQKDSEVPLAVKVWTMFELPLVGEVEPARAAKVPECAPVDTIEVDAPLVVQPEKVPVSNPPLVIPPPPPPPEEPIVQVKLADPEAPVVSLAVTVTLYVPAVVGVPLIRPDEALIDRPGGSPVAL